MNYSGWVKLHRKIWNWPYASDPDYMAIWVYLLTHATHQDMDVIFNGQRVTLKAGQLVTGRKVISEKTGVTQSKVQRVLTRLESEQQIEQQTGNRNRLIALVHWQFYQESEQPNERQMNNKRTTDEHPVNTNKNIKKDKNTKNGRTETTNTFDYPYDEIVALYHEHCPSLAPIRKLTDQRKEMIRKRLKEGYTTDDFIQAFKNIQADDYLAGRKEWKGANIDYILRNGKEDKFLQLLERAEMPEETQTHQQLMEPANREQVMKVVLPNRIDLQTDQWDTLSPIAQEYIIEQCEKKIELCMNQKNQ